MCLNSHICYNSGDAAALKCNGYGFESLLAGYLHKGCVHWRGGSGGGAVHHMHHMWCTAKGLNRPLLTDAAVKSGQLKC